MKIDDIEQQIDAGGIGEIPVEAIKEARHALADEYLNLTMTLDKPSLVTRLHRKRIEERAVKLEKYMQDLDKWLKEVEK